MIEQTGVLNVTELPSELFESLYERLYYSSDIKRRIVSQIILSFSLRTKLKPGSLPIHGLVLLSGPPGTGKTTLAKAASSKAAGLMIGSGLRLLEVDPHALAGSTLGRSQKEVTKLFRETIAEHAAQGPLIVLLDEVETLAASRQKLSLEANPIDVHRATDAVLTQLLPSSRASFSYAQAIFLKR